MDKKAPSSSEAPKEAPRQKSHTSGGWGPGLARRKRMESDGNYKAQGGS